MSLQVWLPFTDGTLKQQGLSSIVPTGTAFTSNASGKMGQCITTTSAGIIDLGINGNQINTGSISFGGWFKFNKTAIGNIINPRTYNSTYPYATGNFIGNASYGGIGLIWTSNNMNTSPPFTSINVFGNIRTNTVNRSTGSYTIAFDTWIHIFLTFNKDNGDLILWINGSPFSTTTFSNFNDARSYPLGINYHGVYGGNGPGLNIPFDCNDIRVYDHCLSPMEVKRISQGLILHYPLNRMGFGQDNLATITSTNQYQWTANSNFHYVWVNSGTLEPNTTYTFSAEVIVSNGVDRCTIFNYSPGDYTGTRNDYFPADGKRHSWTFTTSETAIGLIIYAGPAGQDINNTAVYKNIKIEKGDKATPYIPRNNEAIYNTLGLNSSIEYDTSGFCNNGTKTGTFDWTSDTPKYEVSTHFNGSSYILTDSGTFSWFDFDKCTVAVWMKPTSTPSSWAGTFGIAHNNSSSNKSFVIGNYGGTFTVQSANGGWVNIQSSTLPVNEWHHCVATLDGTTIKMYFDGELVNTYTISWGSITVASDTRVQVGIDLPGSDEIYQGYYSDARIYATALSATDVKSLYQNTATIDADGTIHGAVR